MNTATNTPWVGWLRPPGKRQLWRPVVGAETWEACWAKLYDAGPGDKCVLACGVTPEAVHKARRRRVGT